MPTLPQPAFPLEGAGVPGLGPTASSAQGKMRCQSTYQASQLGPRPLPSTLADTKVRLAL